MTDAKLKELFEQALSDEPTRPFSPDDDIARGRARRARLRRTRLSAGLVAVAVASLGGLVAPELVRPDGDEISAGDGATLPYDELPPFAPESWPMSQEASAHSASPDSGFEEAFRSSQPDRGMADAVLQSLPADVDLADRTAEPQVRRRHITLSVQRDGAPFDLQVWWQLSSDDAQSFRPCSEPAAAFSRTAVWDACSEGTDAQGRWRVIGTPDPQHRVLVVDGYPAAITLAWDTTAEDGTAVDPNAVLHDDEADRVAEAVRETVMSYTATTAGGINNINEFVSQFDMRYVAPRWPDVEAALEDVLGPLARVQLNEPDRAQLANWMVHPPEPKVVTASYRTADGGRVELAVWQTGPIYGVLCTVKTACDVWPGSRDYFRPFLEAPADAKGGTVFGDFGQAYLVLDGIEGDAAALHREALEAVFEQLPHPD